MTDLPKLPEAVACIRTENLSILDECVLWPVHCYDERHDSLIYTAEQMREYAAQVAAAENYSLLSLLFDIRKAAGDAEGRLMQSELVDHIAGLLDVSKCSQTTQSLIRLLIDRDQLGRAKYGKTLDRADLTHAEWLRHMAEEMLDGAGYALAAIRTGSA